MKVTGILQCRYGKGRSLRPLIDVYGVDEANNINLSHLEFVVECVVLHSQCVHLFQQFTVEQGLDLAFQRPIQPPRP